jgi:ferredoxin--NADP+ reductase
VSAPLLPAVEMNIVRPRAPVIARVVRNEPCTSGRSASFVKHLELDVSGTPLEARFRAGQSFGVLAPGEDVRGRAHKVRLYSIACPTRGEDGDGRILSTTPKRLIDEYRPDLGGTPGRGLFLGVCSNYLCDLEAGDEVLLTGPNGKRFLLPAEPERHDYLFLATGTGIAPFRGMVMELLERERGAPGSRIELVMGAPYRTDLLYHDLFTELARAHANFGYHTAISREPGPDKGYVHDYVEAHLDRFQSLLTSERTLIYVCGVEGMQWGLAHMLARHRLAGGYVEAAPALAAIDPDAWTVADMKRALKPTARCMLEVY